MVSVSPSIGETGESQDLSLAFLRPAPGEGPVSLPGLDQLILASGAAIVMDVFTLPCSLTEIEMIIVYRRRESERGVVEFD
jgi:hypothetical protein